jgi:hypothetical protein
MTLPLEGLFVQVATPSLDKKYGGEYVESLMNIRTTLEHFGAEFDWVKFPGCSDLPHARNKILAKFTDHPKATHLMKIDCDIGSDAKDVVRFITSQRDFVAGAGCKKQLPLEWCIGNNSEIDGKKEHCVFKKTGDQIVAYPKSVGTGFVMITKQCALRMRQAYPETMYIDMHDNEKVWALYDPVIIVNGEHRMRHFDDFAFCHRWRKIGGVVAVFPDVHLKHTGMHTFEGSWMDSDDVKEWQKHFDQGVPDATAA